MEYGLNGHFGKRKRKQREPIHSNLVTKDTYLAMANKTIAVCLKKVSKHDMKC